VLPGQWVEFRCSALISRAKSLALIGKSPCGDPIQRHPRLLVRGSPRLSASPARQHPSHWSTGTSLNRVPGMAAAVVRSEAPTMIVVARARQLDAHARITSSALQ
jgi:hypothetical protein